MKRQGFLIQRIASLDNLYLAYYKACRGKRCKKEVVEFRQHFDENMSCLRSEIISGKVQPGHYHFFTIKDPKERLICAAPFRERVLHHALMNVCHEYFDRRLIDDTYATRPGKGIYAALSRASHAAIKYDYLIKLDFRKYYDSIRHDVLKQMLGRMFKDSVLLEIFNQIIDSYHADTGLGLPIGNLTSQYFSNAYLSGFDHYAKENLRVSAYIRYMDDIFLAGNDKVALLSVYKALFDYAEKELGLSLKPPVCNKSIIGVVFLGYRVLPGHCTLSGRSKCRFRSKQIEYDRKLSCGQWDEKEYERHILPLLAFTKHADSQGFRRSCMIISKGNGR